MPYRYLTYTVLLLLLFAGCGQGGGGSASTASAASACSTDPGAGKALLCWTAPTKNSDDSPIYDLAGYNVYWDTTSATLGTLSASKAQVSGANSTTYTVTGLAPGDWYFAVTAYDTSSNESVISNIVIKTVR